MLASGLCRRHYERARRRRRGLWLRVQVSEAALSALEAAHPDVAAAAAASALLERWASGLVVVESE